MPKILMAVGIVLTLIGVGLWLSEGRFDWFGKLPLDMKFHGDKWLLEIPFGSMLVIGFAITIVVNILQKVLK